MLLHPSLISSLLFQETTTCRSIPQLPIPHLPHIIRPHPTPRIPTIIITQSQRNRAASLHGLDDACICVTDPGSWQAFVFELEELEDAFDGVPLGGAVEGGGEEVGLHGLEVGEPVGEAGGLDGGEGAGEGLLAGGPGRWGWGGGVGGWGGGEGVDEVGEGEEGEGGEFHGEVWVVCFEIVEIVG